MMPWMVLSELLAHELEVEVILFGLKEPEAKE
jgi:hypothetical protein